jgi:maltose alpha-D-glucosyltransferase/alpha-amylase
MPAAPWPPRGLVYGIDVSRFQDSDGDGFGDLPGLQGRLDHVAALGASWVWLLPIYPSLRRDNGYDVDDHEAVDERFGTLDDFEAVVEACHARGLSVMIDLVIHHTSERHAWFRDPELRTARYIWADAPVEDPDDEPMFPGEDGTTWSFDEDAGAWYHHQFYAFQPDLDVARDEVFDELARIAALWADRGVDGFRIDAAMPAMKPKPVPGTGADPATFYDRLRRKLAERHPQLVIMGEADVPPEEIGLLTVDGRMNAVLDFSLNNAMFLALARSDAGVLTAELDRLNAAVPVGGRLNFVRNVDELDLDQLTDDERADVFEAFGPKPNMYLYGRGLRRAWAPMLGERFRMSLSLLFALPGVPLIMYGQELGIGDDLSVEGRDACRPVMQWSDEPGLGFSTLAEAPMILPAQLKGAYGAAKVNAHDQREDAGSNLTLTARLSRLRADARLHELSGVLRPDVGARTVFALESAGVLTLHNLGADPVQVPHGAGLKPLLAEGWEDGELGGYGFAWLRRA